MANYEITAQEELVATFRMEEETFNAHFSHTGHMAQAIMADRPELASCRYVKELKDIDGVWYWELRFYLVSDKLTYTEI